MAHVMKELRGVSKLITRGEVFLVRKPCATVGRSSCTIGAKKRMECEMGWDPLRRREDWSNKIKKVRNKE